MTTTITGEYTTAEVFLDEADLEGLTRDQVQEMVDHEAFTQPVKVVPHRSTKRSRNGNL